MIIWVPANTFGLSNPEGQRARIVCIDEGRLIVRSCGDPTKLVEIEAGEVLGVELSDGSRDTCTLRFKAASFAFHTVR